MSDKIPVLTPSSPGHSNAQSQHLERVDTSNLSPGAAARYEKWMRSIDAFTTGVQNKTITLPERK